MTMMGKTCPVRARAFSLSWDKRARRAAMSPLRTECFEIFSPPPGARDVMTQVERLSSSETKIALRSVRIAACSSGRGQRVCMVAPEWVVRHPHSARERGATNHAHGILSRRAETLEVPRPRSDSDAEPVHLLVDSTGLKLCGPGEWLIEKHGTRRRRAWRKLHIGVDADTGRIVAAELTTHDADDGAQVGSLLDQVAALLASFTGDGAYDQDGVYDSVAERHPEARVIVPPRSTAVPSAAAETAPTQRDQHLQLIAEHGRMGWQKASGYNRRALAEATIGRFKRVIGDGLRSRTDQRQATEMNVAVAVLNRMLELGRPKSVPALQPPALAPIPASP